MLTRREFLYLGPVLTGSAAPLEPLAEPHFPSRLYQFVWRNWELANTARMAQVVRASERAILDLGYTMGLPRKRTLSADQLRRLYITVIRQNWHLLPQSQIIGLLGWTAEKFAFTLKEDDFLDVKLGPKPDCPEVVYRQPTAEERQRAARIRQIVRQTLGRAIDQRGEDLFQFVKDLGTVEHSARQSRDRKGAVPAAWDLRYLYSYFALYGDPLLEPELDPFPDGYLEKLARAGINGVWMQAVLNTLAPSDAFPEFGGGWQKRLENLQALVRRARQFGIRILLYLNEPRAMPDAFFVRHPEIRGSRYQDLYAMCTSAPVVRDWIAGSIAHVMRHVPDLGGWFSITMSENHTNCFSHVGAWGREAPKIKDCPRCSKRDSWDVLAELIRAFHQGARGSEVIVWDWGWPDELAARLIPLLPKQVRFQSISEWRQPVERGGVKTTVGEYSISVVGPGPRAQRHWALARENGIRTVAKVQLNNTWEISAVPYIPVPHLILRHCENLSRAGVSGLMASWTCGGYPSPNLEAAKAFYFEPHGTADEILAELAARRYGKQTAPAVVGAWKLFSDAFQEFPYGVAIYIIPTQHGPANLLRSRPTGHAARMMLFPHDDYKRWCGAYPPEVVFRQFEKLAARWKQGLDILRTTPARLDLAVAETCYHHFQSTANQVEFYMLRVRLAEEGPSGRSVLDRMRELAEREIDIAARQFSIARHHSVIAFEASNHYYYTPLDLMEKILNCRDLLDRQLR